MLGRRHAGTDGRTDQQALSKKHNIAPPTRLNGDIKQIKWRSEFGLRLPGEVPCFNRPRTRVTSILNTSLIHWVALIDLEPNGQTIAVSTHTHTYTQASREQATVNAARMAGRYSQQVR